MITVDSGKGNDKTFVKLDSTVELTRFGLRKAWFASGKDMMKKANEEVLAKPRSGNTYFIKRANGSRRKHKASLPGEYHANLTGKLRKSLGWKVKGRDLHFGYGITAKAPKYAGWVENGTKKMEARPTVKNSAFDNVRNTEQHMAFYVRKEFDEK